MGARSFAFLVGVAGLAGCLVTIDESTIGRPLADAGGDAMAEAGPASTYAATVLMDAPIVFYRLTETTGPVAFDSAQHIDGTYGAAVQHSAAGATFSAYTSAPERIVTVPRDTRLEPKSQLTVECWMQPTHTAAQTDSQRVVSYGTTATPYQPYTLQLGSGPGKDIDHPYLFMTQVGQYTAMAPVSKDRVTYVVVTYDGSTVRHYFDGAEIDNLPPAMGGLTNYDTPNGLGIGGAFDGTGIGFVGTLRDVAIYGKPLAADRIAAHYAAGNQERDR